MKSLKIAGLCLASLLVMGMTLAGNASAALLWLLCLEAGGTGTKYEDSSCSKANATGKWESVPLTKSDTVVLQGFTIFLQDTKATGGSSAIRCGHPKPLSTGLIEPNGDLLINTAKVENPKTECERVEGGCKAGEVEKIEGRDLPWLAESSETENTKFLANLREHGNGQPGWEVECNTLLGKQTDTCTSVAAEPELISSVNVLSGGVLLVLAEFLDANKATCTQGGTKAGNVKGQIAVLLASGNGLSLNRK